MTASSKVGDRISVSLSAGRVVDGVVKAIINRTDGVRPQVDYGKDETARSICGRFGRLVRKSSKNGESYARTGGGRSHVLLFSSFHAGLIFYSIHSGN